MIKADEEKEAGSLESMADDQTTKELAGIVNSDVSSVSLQPLNVSSYYMTLNLTERSHFDSSKYSKVLNLHEVNKHPHNFDMNYDIYFGKDDQPVTLMQPQSEDGKHFMAWSSRLALLSEGRHFYNAHRKR